MGKRIKFSHSLFYTFLIFSLCFFYSGSSVKADISTTAEIGVTYNTHVQNIGWQSFVSDGAEAGTVGKSLRLEALNIKLDNAPSGAKIDYQVHVQGIGWQPWVSDGAEAGTSGKALRVEAIRIKLENLPDYSIQYQAQVQSVGWQPFVSDGDEAGTNGKSLRLEAIKIKIVPKVTSISLNKSSDTLNVRDTDTLTANISPTNASSAILNWKSSNLKVATVDSTGKIIAVGAGNCTITAKTEDNKISASSIVTVNDPIVTFKDNNLEQLVRKTINKPIGDLFQDDVADITDLDSENYGNTIKDLSGIENLVNLTSIELNDNEISDISGLKSLTNLKVVYLNHNEISDISVFRNLPELQYLELGNNKISDISIITSLPNLTHLELGNNKITDISAIKGLTKLQYLNLYNNQISDINSIKGLTNLQYMDLYNNQIIDIGAINSLTNLSELILGENKISDVSSIRSLTNLNYLDLSDNQISDTDIQTLKNVLPNVSIGF